MKKQMILNAIATTSLLVAAVTFAACEGNGSAEAVSRGQCTYEDAKTEPSGQPQPEPAKPEPQPAEKPMEVELVVKGQVDLGPLTPPCKGNAVYESEGNLESNGSYTAGFLSSEGRFEAACQIPNLTAVLASDIYVRAKLHNTSKNCASYCEAKARSKAEQSCQAAADRASCWARVEGEYSASCKRECSGTTTRRIVAETKLSSGLVGAFNQDGAGLSGLGRFDANLKFEKIVDEQNGQTVEQ